VEDKFKKTWSHLPYPYFSLVPVPCPAQPAIFVSFTSFYLCLFFLLRSLAPFQRAGFHPFTPYTPIAEPQILFKVIIGKVFGLIRPKTLLIITKPNITELYVTKRNLIYFSLIYSRTQPQPPVVTRFLC